MDILHSENHAGTLYHWPRLSKLPFSPVHNDYLLYFGPISRIKGVHYVVEVAKYLQMNFVITSPPHGVNRGYFEKCISPILDNRMKYLGEIDEDTQITLMSRALCMIHPATDLPPSGSFVADALATGCPVVAFQTKFEQDLVINGKTGYVVSDIEEMITAVQEIRTISRKECRSHALAQEIKNS